MDRETEMMVFNKRGCLYIPADIIVDFKIPNFVFYNHDRIRD